MYLTAKEEDSYGSLVNFNDQAAKLSSINMRAASVYTDNGSMPVR